jgi:16S rRNA (cytosine1402-N4)-methyltransferase
MIIQHDSVMTEEILTYLSPQKPNTLFVDATMGEGGHTKAMLEAYPGIRAVGVDADSTIIAKAKKRLEDFNDHITFYNTWYDEFFTEYSLDHRPDRILFDLGISSFHYAEAHRGFSFKSEEALDMRLDTGQKETAGDIVNTYPEKDISDIFYRFGEERYAKRIARSIVQERRKSEIRTAGDLERLIWKTVPHSYRHAAIHPATRCFQALRIAVNRELERLKTALSAAFNVLEIEGRIAVIAFHSLEDRIVKRFFKEKARTCICPPEVLQCRCGGIQELQLINRKPVLPKPEEINRNSRARSAKLRVAEKIGERTEQA